MARTIKDSLALLKTSMTDIDNALKGKDVAGTTELGKVAEQVRGIETKPKTASITLEVYSDLYKQNTAYVTCCKGGGSYTVASAFKGDIVEQKQTSFPKAGTNYYITFENLPINQSYHFYVRPTNSSQRADLTYIYESPVPVVNVTEAKEYKATTSLSLGPIIGEVTDPTNPDGPEIFD